MDVKEILDSFASRKSFLIGLAFIAKADGILEEREVAFFRDAAIALDLDEDSIREVDACWSLEVCPPLEFSNTLQKRFFLREAIELCCIDEHYAKEEKHLVRQFAKTLGISSNTVKVLEDWVQRGMAWKHEGDELIKKGD